MYVCIVYVCTYIEFMELHTVLITCNQRNIHNCVCDLHYNPVIVLYSHPCTYLVLSDIFPCIHLPLPPPVRYLGLLAMSKILPNQPKAVLQLK